jgi:hypothetical protein
MPGPMSGQTFICFGKHGCPFLPKQEKGPMSIDPQFIGIGLGKCGTTWLHEQLAAHPEVWVPPVKELNWFNVRGDNHFRMLHSRHPFHRNWRAWVAKWMLHAGYIHRPATGWWYMRYLFGRRSISWYRSLFPNNGLVRGEISPAYCYLAPEEVAFFARQLPDTKLIYLIRNPVDWVWSIVKWEYLKLQGRDNFNNNYLPYLKKRLANKEFRNRMAHSQNIDHWLEYYPEEQLFIGFFDQIKNDPVSLLADVAAFLGIETDGFSTEKAAQVANLNVAGAGYSIPDEVRDLLQTDLGEELQSLAERFPQCRAWIQEQNS